MKSLWHLCFWCRKDVRPHHPVLLPHTERWYLLLWDIPADACSGHKSVARLGVALRLCKGHKVLLQLFTFLLLCFVFLLIHRPASCTVSLYWAKKGGVLFCNWYYWAQGEYLHGFAEFWTIFSSSQRKKQKKQPNHQLLTVLLTDLHFQAVLPHRMAAGEFHYASWSWFTARCLLFPQVPVRIFLLPLFLNGSLPTPRGPLLPCDNSLLAARSLLGKIKSTGEDEVCQSSSHARQSIISICCEHLTFTGKSDDPTSISILGM